MLEDRTVRRPHQRAWTHPCGTGAGPTDMGTSLCTRSFLLARFSAGRRNKHCVRTSVLCKRKHIDVCERDTPRTRTTVMSAAQSATASPATKRGIRSAEVNDGRFSTVSHRNTTEDSQAFPEPHDAAHAAVSGLKRVLQSAMGSSDTPWVHVGVFCMIAAVLSMAPLPAIGAACLKRLQNVASRPGRLMLRLRRRRAAKLQIAAADQLAPGEVALPAPGPGEDAPAAEAAFPAQQPDDPDAAAPSQRSSVGGALQQGSNRAAGNRIVLISRPSVSVRPALLASSSLPGSSSPTGNLATFIPEATSLLAGHSHARLAAEGTSTTDIAAAGPSEGPAEQPASSNGAAHSTATGQQQDLSSSAAPTVRPGASTMASAAPAAGLDPDTLITHDSGSSSGPSARTLSTNLPYPQATEHCMQRLNQALNTDAASAAGGMDGGADACVSEAMSVASFRSEGANAGGDGMTMDGMGSASEDGMSDAGVMGGGDGELAVGEASFLGLPPCVGTHVLDCMDADAVRILRQVCKSLYWEASRGVCSLVVTPGNLETLVAMQVHVLMPHIQRLVFRAGAPTGAKNLPPGASVGPQAPPEEGCHAANPLLPLGTVSRPRTSAGIETDYFASTPADTALLLRFIHEVLPELKELRVVDMSDAPLHVSSVWSALLDCLPGPRTKLVLREHTPWARGAMGLLGNPESLGDATDYYPEMLDAVKKVARHSVNKQHMQTLGQQVVPLITVELLGVTVRRNTAARLPQLCSLQCITALTLFGKSATAATHGHRLAGHLAAVASLRHLTRLELLSYEDVSDAELAPLTSCTALKHLYLDSLFIKQADGPVFPSLTSLSAARIKFILRPLTTIFPALTHLRLGVLHSELNKKISSASLSCLAGCTTQLSQLCVCPVLWKGQWQVLPTLKGLTTLQLVHCRDLSHLREVLRVVARTSSLKRLELHAASTAVPQWPGAASDTADVGAAAAAPAVAAMAQVEIAAVAAAAGAAVAAAGGDPDEVAAAVAVAGALAEDSIEVAGSVVDANIYAGLAGMESLEELIIAESSGRLVRHLVAAELPKLRRLELRGMGPALRMGDLQAAVLALPAVTQLVVHASGDFGAAAVMALPGMLDRPALQVEWRSTSQYPSLLFTRDCGVQDSLTLAKGE